MKPHPFLIQHSHVPLASAMQRRRKLLALSALLCLGAVAGMPKATHAQDVWPSKPLRLIVPFTPGGVTDTSGRLIAESLGKRLGQQIVVDNKPGASGNIGTALAKSAPADGYTLVLGFDGTMVINPHVFSKLPFDTAKDFAPVGKIGDATLVLVANPGVPVKGLADVIALSKTQPGGLSFGTSGTGGTPHIAGELLKIRTGANLTHVPYKGGGQAMTDVLGGTIPLVYTAVAGAHGHIKSGKLKAIAVSSAQRTSALPDVPTFVESGVADFVVNSWVGLLAPVGTPAAVITRLNTELNAVLNDAAVREKLRVMGIEPTPGTAEQYRDEIKRDLDRYGAVVKAAGISIE
ncbi:tripartite-type tricarboxylate transporter receptor subunit TctC [Acidovorax delafieldii]|uniref:Tripartite-type tricarboxylate transporter receptor subunit TctC n=2 Tax=Acidovorax delafieldii TaxID=47920 RepID=A0AAJ2BUU0_ACIDE|nr:tripartite tricarboxylate transporter substrate binding protein [Acidovorax delafieldii]MDR6768246.1 tripartite-type tricarboxylate transporter receptor subunit TctC [Acidovorax delafieldii]MDR6837724.1 tripartite-type tricarboxylate transporter receptor subunit TctC [Acidovorax delafieldii]MDR7367214.1 tripartite-type tricarboxylate transporter receptor subunit TctC [Acidovorax delafieldii]